mgnify:CR=1 FL=1
MKFFSLILVGLMTLASMDADAARRFGGGRSFGKQSGNVTQRDAAPTAPGGATQNAAAKPAPANAAPGAAGAVAPRRPFGAMLGGLAAGLGLAWLAHSLGLGEEFGQILLFGLLALAVMVVIRMVMRARAGGANRSRSPFAFQGAADASNAVTPSQYSPDKVGNDASARPWERGVTAFQSNSPVSGSTGSIIGSALVGSQNWGVPAGFDTEGFLVAAKRNFVTLQDAWDRSDVVTLRSMMTDEMVGEIKSQLAEREAHQDGQPNRTDVVTLEAQLLGIEDMGDGYMASVEFTGIIREQPSAGPSPFREVWNMTKPKAGSAGWLVAGVQALQ